MVGSPFPRLEGTGFCVCEHKKEGKHDAPPLVIRLLFNQQVFHIINIQPGVTHTQQ